MWFPISPDPTLTVMNVSSVMGKVKVHNRRKVWKEVLIKENFTGNVTILLKQDDLVPSLISWSSPTDDYTDNIYSGHSTEEEKNHTCSDVYVNCHPESSWEHLTSRLYRADETAAVDQARPFLPPRGMWGDSVDHYQYKHLMIFVAVHVRNGYSDVGIILGWCESLIKGWAFTQSNFACWMDQLAGSTHCHCTIYTILYEAREQCWIYSQQYAGMCTMLLPGLPFLS